jgi:hypothetical protein
MDDRFFGDVALLTEASRLRPAFAAEVLEASTDEQVDKLVEEARKIVLDASEHSVM